MFRIFPSIVLSVLILSGCHNTTEPVINTNSDDITITSDELGFSFSQGVVIFNPNTQNIIPDIRVTVNTNPNNLTVIGVMLTPADTFITTFKLIKEFNQVDSAKAFFSNTIEVSDSVLFNSQVPVEAYQIWAVKTKDNKYGKILILHTIAYEVHKYPGFRSYYAETTIKWKYQPDGSRNL